jgi:hypothetical protein
MERAGYEFSDIVGYGIFENFEQDTELIFNQRFRDG